jgi:hypothetical protein
MKKEMEQVLQETIKVEHSKSLEGIELPKINFEEVVTFQNKEQDHFVDITKKSKPKNCRPTKNHPPKLRRVATKLKISWEPIWDLTKNQTFWYHKTILSNPHVKECEISQL